MKKTAVQWLAEQINDHYFITNNFKPYIEQALQMENEITNKLKERIDDLENYILEMNERN